jgi:hypothetical protein
MKKIFNVLLMMLPLFLFAQKEVTEEGVAGLKDFFGLSSLYRSAFYIGGAILVVGAAWVIWALARKKEHAAEGVIAWFVAFMFFLLLKYIF